MSHFFPKLSDVRSFFYCTKVKVDTREECATFQVKLFAQSQRPLPLNATPTIVGVAVPGDGRTVNASSQIESWVKQKVAINIVDDHIEKDISLHGQNGT